MSFRIEEKTKQEDDRSEDDKEDQRRRRRWKKNALKKRRRKERQGDGNEEDEEDEGDRHDDDDEHDRGNDGGNDGHDEGGGKRSNETRQWDDIDLFFDFGEGEDGGGSEEGRGQCSERNGNERNDKPTTTFLVPLSTMAHDGVRSFSKPPKSEATVVIKNLAWKQHSAALTQIASGIASMVTVGAHTGEDLFAKIEWPIQDLLAKSQAEAAAGATEETFGEKELAKKAAETKQLGRDTWRWTWTRMGLIMLATVWRCRQSIVCDDSCAFE